MSTENDAAVSAQIEKEMAELRAELGGQKAPEEAAPEADSVEGDPEADEESEETEEEESEPALEEADGEAARAEVAKLFADGDLKGACDKLGLDPAIFKLNNRQFAAARKAESEAKRLTAEASAREAAAEARAKQAEALQAGAEKVYGPIVAGNRAYRVDRDMAKAKAALELLFEDSFENVVANIQKGVQPLTPAELRVIELEKKLEAEKAAKEKESASATAAQQQAQDVEKVSARLAGTPLEGVEGAAEEIVKAIRASYNPALKKHTVTLKEAYQQVKAAYAKKAAQLAKLAGKPRAAAEDDEPEAKPAKRGAVRKPIAGTRAPAPARALTEEEKMAAEMKQARREFEAQQRRENRSKR